MAYTHSLSTTILSRPVEASWPRPGTAYYRRLHPWPCGLRPPAVHQPPRRCCGSPQRTTGPGDPRGQVASLSSSTGAAGGSSAATPQPYTSHADTEPADGGERGDGAPPGGGAAPPDSGKSLLQTALDIGIFAAPLAVQNVMGYSLNALSGSLIGRLGPTTLSASTLGNSAYCISGLSLVWGGAAGLETLVGQAHGAGQPRLMRLVLLRAVLVSWAVCLPVVALWLNAEGLLLALGQSPALVAPAATYLQSLAPSLFAYVLSDCLQVYLVVQGQSKVTTAAKLVVTALGPLYYLGCIFWLGLGLPGAGYAYALCKATNAALLLGWMGWRAGRRGTPPPLPPSPAPPEVAAPAWSSASDVTTGATATATATSSSPAPDLEVYTATAAAAGNGGQDQHPPHHQKQQQQVQQQRATPPQPVAGLAAEATSGRGPVNAAVAPAVAVSAASAAASRLGPRASCWAERLRAAVAEARREVAEALDPVACREYVRFGVPAAVMCCLEWWAYEALVIMAGWLPNADLAVGCLGICLTVGAWAYMVPQAIATATCARVAAALGAGDAATAKRNWQAAYGLVMAVQVALGCCLLPNAAWVAACFCPDPAAAALTASLLPITAVNTLGDGLNCVLNNGVLRACGRQDLGARMHLVSYWCCGLPAAYAAAFKLGLGVSGFVAAIGAASLMQSLVVVTLLCRWDWQVQVRNAQKLLSDMAPPGTPTPTTPTVTTTSTRGSADGAAAPGDGAGGTDAATAEGATFDLSSASESVHGRVSVAAAG